VVTLLVSCGYHNNLFLKVKIHDFLLWAIPSGQYIPKITALSTEPRARYFGPLGSNAYYFKNDPALVPYATQNLFAFDKYFHICQIHLKLGGMGG
jgi:hypothetical protein